VTALNQPFAAISTTDLSGCNQVSISNIDCSFVAAWRIFLSVLLGENWIGSW